MEIEDSVEEESFSPVFVQNSYIQMSDCELFRNKAMMVMYVLKTLVETEGGVESDGCPVVNAYSIAMEVLEGR